MKEGQEVRMEEGKCSEDRKGEKLEISKDE